MQIIQKKLSEIVPYEKNPRKNDNAVDYVANSIKEFGFKVPIVIDKDGVIVAGHTRYKASRKLHLESVPCIVADDLTDEQIKAYRLADNKVSEQAEWDDDLLKIELDDIFNIDMEGFGFDLNIGMDEDVEVEEDDFEPDVPEEPKAKRGDIYQLGNHRLMCGDSTSKEDVEKLMDGKKADMVVTDPPYAVAYTGGMKIENGKIKSNQKKMIENDAMSDNQLYNFLFDVYSNIRNNTNDRSGIYIFYAHSKTRQFVSAFQDAGLKQRSILIWHKTSGGFGDFMAQYMNAYEPFIYGSNGEAVNWYGENNEKTVWSMDKVSKCDLHPTMKPVPVISRAIKNSSRMNDSVLDLFGGSGTTLIACEQMNRKCFMMEFDAHYVDVIIARWEQLTGQKAELING